MTDTGLLSRIRREADACFANGPPPAGAFDELKVSARTRARARGAVQTRPGLLYTHAHADRSSSSSTRPRTQYRRRCWRR